MTGWMLAWSCSAAACHAVHSASSRAEFSAEHPFHCRDDLPVRGMYSDRGSRQDRDRDRGGFGDRRGHGRDRYERQSSPGESCWPGLPRTLQLVLRRMSHRLHL